MMTNRTCRTCSIEKPIEEYYISNTGTKGQVYRRTICKPCYSENECNRHIKKRYNMDVSDYDKLLEEQGSACAICETTEPQGQGRFHIDHNHTTGEVRGLLCHSCNSGIGHLQDSPVILAEAIKYLVERGHYG